MGNESFANQIDQGRLSYMAETGTLRWSGQDLTEDEEEGLLRGLDAGLIELSADLRALVLVAFPPTRAGGVKTYRLFSHWKDNAYWSWRESFVQIATAVELVLDAGWPPERVALEAFDFDIACLDGPDPRVLIEAKVHVKDLDEQRRVLLGESVNPSSTDVNRRRDLLRFQPDVYGAVAQGCRRYYELTVSSHEAIQLTPCAMPAFDDRGRRSE